MATPPVRSCSCPSARNEIRRRGTAFATKSKNEIETAGFTFEQVLGAKSR